MSRRPVVKSVTRMKRTNGAAPRQKGDRFERECVNKLLAGGIMAERVPLSGSAGGSFDADIQVMLQSEMKKFECKMRGRAWADLYKWLGAAGTCGLFIRCNNQKPLVVLPFETFVELHGTKW